MVYFDLWQQWFTFWQEIVIHDFSDLFINLLIKTYYNKKKKKKKKKKGKKKGFKGHIKTGQNGVAPWNDMFFFVECAVIWFFMIDHFFIQGNLIADY